MVESKVEEKWSGADPCKLLDLSGTSVSQKASETWDSEMTQTYMSIFANPETPDYWVQSPPKPPTWQQLREMAA